MDARRLADIPMSRERREAIARFIMEARRASGGAFVRAILYGSVARGESRSDSDVDLIVVWRGSPAAALHLLVAITTDILLDTGVDLSVHPVTEEGLAELARIRTGFYENVERDGLLVEG